MGLGDKYFMGWAINFYGRVHNLFMGWRNATFVLFKAQDFYWLTILLLCYHILSPFLVFEAFWWEKARVCVFSCGVVVCYHALCRAHRNLNHAVAT